MKVISTEKAPAAIGPYSQAIEIGGMLFASGQIPVDPATGEVPEGITAQAEQSCKNVLQKCRRNFGRSRPWLRKRSKNHLLFGRYGRLCRL